MQAPPLQTWSPVQLAHGSGTTTTHLPPRHVPPAHAAPSGSVSRHLPFLRFLHGGHFFVFAAPASREAAPRPPSAPTKVAATARRREPRVVKERERAAKRSGAKA